MHKKSVKMEIERSKPIMIKPKRLEPGDTIAIVSLSWGGLGDPELLHKYEIAKKRLTEDFHLNVVTMPHALSGSAFINAHPELRAKDLMDAFRDPDINGIFSAIGGDDSVRILPYIDKAVFRAHPKVFMGYSDTTITHFMLYQAGLVSFYGPSIMCEFGEYVQMLPYTENAVRKMLFEATKDFKILSSPEWSDEYIPWCKANQNVQRKMKPEVHGYELLQGEGRVKGHLLGGCIDVFTMCIGTSIWPDLSAWEGALLFIETSEDKPSPDFVKYVLRNLAAQGIFDVINGIIVGKPQGEVYYKDYQAVLMTVVGLEAGRSDLPILYNVNIGHAFPTGVLPYGIQAEINCEAKTLTLLENATC
ncbi:MAG: hypothetical protein PWP38_2746 [Clostridiales bacterium]|nr:hypothetical protein [Clostridiales bacterium]